jgi:hypothetical protein
LVAGNLAKAVENVAFNVQVEIFCKWEIAACYILL